MARQIRFPHRLVAILTLIGIASILGCSSTPFAVFQKKNSNIADYKPIASKSSKSSWLPSWKVPKMPWTKSEPKVSTYRPKNTSTWHRMSKTSKQWWNKTTEMLDPYPDPKPSTYSSVNSPSKKKSNWFSGMFQSKEPKKIETLPDWLRQESPKY
jgi:hypothetical protein